MSSSDNKEKQQQKLHDEVELIRANSKISNTIESSVIIEVSSKTNIPKKVSINSNTNNSVSSPNSLFGCPIDKCNPRKIGSLNAFFYVNNSPMIVIGPHCKYFIIIF